MNNEKMIQRQNGKLFMECEGEFGYKYVATCNNPNICNSSG